MPEKKLKALTSDDKGNRRLTNRVLYIGKVRGTGTHRRRSNKTHFRGGKPGPWRHAKSLLETLLSWRKEHGLREFFLGTTEQFLAAYRIYEKRIFKITKTNQQPRFPVMVVDTKFCAWAL